MGLIALVVYIVVDNQPIMNFVYKDTFTSAADCQTFLKSADAQEPMEMLEAYMHRQHPSIHFVLAPKCEIPGATRDAI